MKTTLSLSAAALLLASAATADPWNGLYAGVSVGSNSWTSTLSGTDTETNTLINLGYNTQMGSIVLGVEAHYGNLTYSSGGSETRSGAAIRAGYLVTPGVLAYASYGNSYYAAEMMTYDFMGVGAEFAAFGDTTADVEYRTYSAAASTWDGSEISLGLNWHF